MPAEATGSGFRVLALACDPQLPGNASQFVGQRHGGQLRRLALEKLLDPRGEHAAAFAVPQVPDDGGRADHQCAAQALVPSSRNDAEPYLTGGRMIFWRQPDPGCELPTRSKHLGRRRLHDKHPSADRAAPGDLSKAPATWVGFVPGHEFPLDLIDLRLQLRIFLGMSREELSSQAAEAFIGLNASEQGSEVSNPLGGGQTELCRIASDRIGELGAITNQPIA